MKVITKVRFREKDNYAVVHEVGTEFECDEERGHYLINKGFVEAVKTKKVEKPAEAVAEQPAEAEVEQPAAEQPKEAKRKKKNTMPFNDNETAE